MSILTENSFSLGNLYVAYRKAKAEAFYENTHFHALAFAEYEQDLHNNLKKLRGRLVERSANWYTDATFIGDHAYLPKSVDCKLWDGSNEGHFRALDPKADWEHRFNEAGQRAQASLRLVIRPTVDFQVVSALWVLIVGHLFDGVIDQTASFGNRLRRSGLLPKEARTGAHGVNLSTPGLFAPYFSAYREWRDRGLTSMEKALKGDTNVLAVTMDIERFYHRVSPRFLLRPSFLKSNGLTLTRKERQFTERLLEAITTWYKGTPDWLARKQGAIPVGLSASKIISNVLLAEFDKILVEKLNPLYYGRYVDDVFLVLRADESDRGAQRVTARIAVALSPIVKVRRNDQGPDSLTLHLPYARDSELIFAGQKQKIFYLSSAHGLDLVHQIRDQIRQQSSEYRLLPAVPSAGIAMASRALLATSSAALQADALRKADVVSVRRLGFALLLSDIETYAADLRPATWDAIRSEFYQLVTRHVVTPVGFFEYFGYIPRVFGLMLACGDTREAKALVASLAKVAELLLTTTTLGESRLNESFRLCMQQYARALLQSGIQAATALTGRVSESFHAVLKKLRSLDSTLVIPRSIESLDKTVKQVLLADWGRRAYKDYWFQDQKRDETGPRVPREIEIRRLLRLGAIRKFRRQATNLKAPHWPALVFPTRPLRLDEIGLVAPLVLSDSSLFRSAVRFLRGAQVASNSSLGFVSDDENSSISFFLATGKPKSRIRIAVTSLETTEAQWAAAAKNAQDRSLARYETFNGLINRILKESNRPDYIVMPELSVPLRWALRASRKLAFNGVSLLAGVEYHRDPNTGRLRNDCLVSLTTHWPGYASSIVVLQPKFVAAHGERLALKKLLGKSTEIFTPNSELAKPTLYNHRGFFFSVLICSDLTNISHRRDLRGEIDALFALEWNRDTRTFSSLVESAANDLHAFVIQANNRIYGDSRIRSPAAEDYARDLVQVKGGISDYYVLGEIDYEQLRSEQRRRVVKRAKFKPVPIGYRMSKRRR